MWDALNYNAARDKVASFAAKIEQVLVFRPIAASLAEQVSVLGRLTGDAVENKFNLTDVYYNAIQRFARGEYADSLARVWRLMEGVLYFRLRKIGGNPLEPGKSSNAKIADACCRLRLSPDTPIGVYHLMKLLHEADTAWFKSLRSLYLQPPPVSASGTLSGDKLGSAMRNVRIARNESVVGHNMRPISENCALLGLRVGKTILHHVFSSEVAFIEEYPLQPQRLGALAGLLR